MIRLASIYGPSFDMSTSSKTQNHHNMDGGVRCANKPSGTRRTIYPKTEISYHLHIYNIVKVDTLTQNKQHIQIYTAIPPIERNIDN